MKTIRIEVSVILMANRQNLTSIHYGHFAYGMRVHHGFFCVNHACIQFLRFASKDL